MEITNICGKVFDFWQSIKDSFRYYDKSVLITMSMNERSQGQKGIRHAMSHGGRNQTPVLLFFLLQQWEEPSSKSIITMSNLDIFIIGLNN